VRRAVQAVFCIDVRSEVFRRHLEAVSPEIGTGGFAGFFGFPIEYVPLGHDTGGAQCPVLLSPKARVREGLRGADAAEERAATDLRRLRRGVAARGAASGPRPPRASRSSSRRGCCTAPSCWATAWG
jgi:hypothetical protein